MLPQPLQAGQQRGEYEIVFISTFDGSTATAIWRPVYMTEEYVTEKPPSAEVHLRSVTSLATFVVSTARRTISTASSLYPPSIAGPGSSTSPPCSWSGTS